MAYTTTNLLPGAGAPPPPGQDEELHSYRAGVIPNEPARASVPNPAAAGAPVAAGPGVPAPVADVPTGRVAVPPTGAAWTDGVTPAGADASGEGVPAVLVSGVPPPGDAVAADA